MARQRDGGLELHIASADFGTNRVTFVNSTGSYSVTMPMPDWKLLLRPDYIRVTVTAVSVPKT